MRVIQLYRPRLPGLRAQAISVVHTAHALAESGHHVTLLADSSDTPNATTLLALQLLGLHPHPRFDLRISPFRHKTPAGAWFRTQLGRWWAGPPGVVLARDKHRLLSAMRWLPKRHQVLIETHELDSWLSRERGRDDQQALHLERGVLAIADGLIANCGGTLKAWQEAHGSRMPKRVGIAHNGTAPDRVRRHTPSDKAVIRYVGSLPDYKGIDTLITAAPSLPVPLELVGGSTEQRALIPDNIHCRAPVPYGQVPDFLAQAAALVLPLADNAFGQSMSSPLKLWDYLATSTPIVAADVPSVHEIAAMSGVRFHLYTPGEPIALVHAVRASLNAPPRSPFLRTWAERAQQISAFFPEDK
jgi:glycosyltransferase involved in cell wall biosynthesis